MLEQQIFRSICVGGKTRGNHLALWKGGALQDSKKSWQMKSRRCLEGLRDSMNKSHKEKSGWEEKKHT